MSEAIHAAPAVRLQNVSHRYGRGSKSAEVLREVSLTIPQHSFTAIMGPSGSGKTTLLHCASGLDRPSAGEVWLGDTELSGLSEKGRTKLRRRRIGFIFQRFNLLPALTVDQNVRLPAMLGRRNLEDNAVHDCLSSVGLDSYADRRPSELSGGQQQRVAIARALVTQPEVVFADEPTGSLDLENAHFVLDLLRSSVDQRGQTVVMVTHDPVAAATADSVVFFADGRPVEQVARLSADDVARRMTQLRPSRSR